MVVIEDMHHYLGSEIEGLFRLSVVESRVDRYGRAYTYLILEDHNGALPAYVWAAGEGMRTPLQCGAPVHARLKVRQLQNRLIGHITALAQTALPAINPLQLLSRRTLPRPDLAARLQTFIDQCDTAPLRHFLGGVFSDVSFARAFLTVPASQSHHHAYPGGLAEHSLEVAHMIQTAVTHEDPSMAELTGVAGLLHDVGKIALLKENGDRTQAGFVLRHEALTLERVAPALADLDARWPEGATALRYLLTWQLDGQARRPLLPAALALQFADRYSSARGARERAFSGAPDWKRFARLDTAGPISRFWRPDTRRANSAQPAALENMTRESAV